MKTKTFECGSCGVETVNVICDDCNTQTIKDLLGSPSWIANAKTRTGDLPGETMYDTIKREAHSIDG